MRLARRTAHERMSPVQAMKADCPRCWNDPCTCGYDRRTPGGGMSPREEERAVKYAVLLEKRVAELERQMAMLLDRFALDE